MVRWHVYEWACLRTTDAVYEAVAMSAGPARWRQMLIGDAEAAAFMIQLLAAITWQGTGGRGLGFGSQDHSWCWSKT